jgi:hypothetical protein
VFASAGACVAEFLPIERRNASTAASPCRTERENGHFAVTHSAKTFAQL